MLPRSKLLPPRRNADRKRSSYRQIPEFRVSNAIRFIRAGSVKIYEFFRPVAIDRERFVPVKSSNCNGIGDICSATISGKRFSLVSVYVSPNTSFESIKEFSVLNLMVYSPKLKGLIETLEKYDYNDANTYARWWWLESRRTCSARVTLLSTALRLELSNVFGTSHNTTCITPLFIATPSSLKQLLKKAAKKYFSTRRPLLPIISYFKNSHILNDKNPVV